ncbi:BolA family protein [Legionella septentrionalis]
MTNKQLLRILSNLTNFYAVVIMSRKQRIHDALVVTLKPVILRVDDESKRHHVPSGAETHFKVVAISPAFNNLPRLARHRLVNSLLSEEFDGGMHALSLFLYTPDEWAEQSNVPASPACRDGMRHG